MDQINSHKTKHTSRRPAEFRESLAPALPMAPMARPAKLDSEPVASDAPPARVDWLRYGLYLVWALAAVAAGTGVGIMLNSSRFTVAEEAPVPVATAPLAVAAAPDSSLVAPAAAPTQGALGVAPAASAAQAQAGNPFAVTSITAFQPATTNQLQPGFSPAGLPQGTLGTAAVR